MSKLGLDVKLSDDSSNYDDDRAILNQDQDLCEKIMFSPSSNSTPSMRELLMFVLHDKLKFESQAFIFKTTMLHNAT
jgi:hypothetical protein